MNVLGQVECFVCSLAPYKSWIRYYKIWNEVQSTMDDIRLEFEPTTDFEADIYCFTAPVIFKRISSRMIFSSRKISLLILQANGWMEVFQFHCLMFTSWNANKQRCWTGIERFHWQWSFRQACCHRFDKNFSNKNGTNVQLPGEGFFIRTTPPRMEALFIISVPAGGGSHSHSFSIDKWYLWLTKTILIFEVIYIYG